MYRTNSVDNWFDGSQRFSQMFPTVICLLVKIIVLLSFFNNSYAHVALTFPRARRYDIDFLDNTRTPGPCGMPQGDVKTSLLTGSTFNVSWHLAYPHKGGFRLQILDALDRPLIDLTPVTQQSEFVNEDATAQSYPVKLPENFTCTDCTIRLLREAEEWGVNYRFWSCADIDILDRKLYRENCSGHGRYLLGRCRCDRFYHGSRCEFKENCLDDTDCGNQGVCIDNGGTTSPTKHCYCNIGWYGAGCRKRSPVKTTEIDLEGYTIKQFSDDFSFYWRILKDTSELEGVMVINDTSWVGIGWRPSNLTPDCRAFPKIFDKNHVDQLSSPEPNSETNNSNSTFHQSIFYDIETSNKPIIEPLKSAAKRRSAKTHSELAVTPRIDSDVTIETSVTYRVSTKQGRKKRTSEMDLIKPIGEPSIGVPEKTSKPDSIYESIPNFEITLSSQFNSELPNKSQPTTKPIQTHQFISEPKLKLEPITESSSFTDNITLDSLPELNRPRINSVPKIQSVSNLMDIKNFQSNIEKTLMDEEPYIKSGATKGPVRPIIHKYTPKHDFNPMDCTDMIIGMARGNTHRIDDYYTRDRSTPRTDEFWGGENSLTAAMGFEENGVTTIIFRRKLASNELTDHAIIDSDMQVIWARGQQSGKYIHQPPSGIEENKAGVKEFYKSDELKYHGHRSQRGVATLNFFDEKNKGKLGGHIPLENTYCKGEWKYPRNCMVKNGTCEYYIHWNYKTNNDQMRFTIITKDTDTWTGVGFSEDEKMTQTDAILGWVDKINGRPFVMDTWISGYSAPLLDSSQDIYNISGKIENGMTTLNFSRKRTTKDNKDFSFTDEHCLFMIFPVKGGMFNPVNKKIRKHTSIPIISSERICLKSCGIDEDDETHSSTASSKIYYHIQIKLTNLGNGFKAPRPGTRDFNVISNRISNAFKPALIQKLPQYYDIKLDDINNDDDNDGIIAKIHLIMNKDETEGRALQNSETIAITEQILKEALSTGQIGSLAVDPQYLVVSVPLANEINNTSQTESTRSDDVILSITKLYIIIGCVAALILLALIQASCTLYKSTRKRTTKERLIADNAWRDYSMGSKTNFAFETFETEEKAPPPPVSSLPLSRDTLDGVLTPRSGGIQTAETENYKLTTQQQFSTPRTTYSLPRAPGTKQPSPPPQHEYYTQDRRNNRSKNHNIEHCQSLAQQPDFYFMPSQRKYSGEVVRVYVDYNGQKSK